MTWSDIYLLCFLVGFSLSVLSFVAGAVHIHLPFKMHFPFHGGGHRRVDVDMSSAAMAGCRPRFGQPRERCGCAGRVPWQRTIAWFNPTTAMAFLAWFGGVGYILTVIRT